VAILQLIQVSLVFLPASVLSYLAYVQRYLCHPANGVSIPVEVIDA